MQQLPPKKKRCLLNSEGIVIILAERVGFEPTLPCGKHALQACALGRTTLPLRMNARFFSAGRGDYTTKILLLFISKAGIIPHTAGG
jgi:hypothetical protein